MRLRGLELEDKGDKKHKGDKKLRNNRIRPQSWMSESGESS